MSGDMETAVYNYIKENINVTCINLANKFGYGDGVLFQGKNVIVAYGLGEELLDTLCSLLEQSKIMFVPSTILEHALDGSCIEFPVVKGVPPAKGYKHPHWMPTGFATYESGVKFMKHVFRNDPEELNRLMVKLEEKKGQKVHCT